VRAPCCPIESELFGREKVFYRGAGAAAPAAFAGLEIAERVRPSFSMKSANCRSIAAKIVSVFRRGELNVWVARGRSR